MSPALNFVTKFFSVGAKIRVGKIFGRKKKVQGATTVKSLPLQIVFIALVTASEADTDNEQNICHSIELVTNG